MANAFWLIVIEPELPVTTERQIVPAGMTLALSVIGQPAYRSSPNEPVTTGEPEVTAHGPTLVAEHIVALDLLDPAPVMRALIEELDRLAKELDCSAIRAMVLGQESLVATGLRAAGHRPEGATLWKRLLGEGGAPRPRVPAG